MCTCQERKHDIKDTVRFPQNMHVRRRIGNNWPRLCPYVTLTGWDSVQESFKEGNDKRQSLWRTPLGEKLFLGRERLDYPLPLMPLQPDPTVHPHLPWDHSSLTLTPSQSLPRKTTYEILYLNAPNFNTSPPPLPHAYAHILTLKMFPPPVFELGAIAKHACWVCISTFCAGVTACAMVMSPLAPAGANTDVVGGADLCWLVFWCWDWLFQCHDRRVQAPFKCCQVHTFGHENRFSSDSPTMWNAFLTL